MVRVKIEVEFEVEADNPTDVLTYVDAKTAAELAAFDYLSFVTVSGVNTDTEEVEVHVDGYGKCRVKLVEP